MILSFLCTKGIFILYIIIFLSNYVTDEISKIISIIFSPKTNILLYNCIIWLSWSLILLVVHNSYGILCIICSEAHADFMWKTVTSLISQLSTYLSFWTILNRIVFSKGSQALYNIKFGISEYFLASLALNYDVIHFCNPSVLYFHRHVLFYLLQMF